MVLKNKKGIGLEWYFLIIAFFLGLGFYFVNYLGEHKVIKNYIGQYQFSILKANNNAENALFYIGQSSKNALQQSIYELAQNGGFAITEHEEGIILQEESSLTSEAKCGKFDGYNAWYKLVKDELGNYEKISCFEQNLLSTDLQYIFNKNLNQYILNHPHNIPINNYYYDLRENLEIIGYAKSPLSFDILKDNTKISVKRAIEIKIPKAQLEQPSIEPKEKPTESKIQETKDFIDFTGTDLCVKGVNCRLTKEAYDLLLKADAMAKKRLKELSLKYACLDNEKTTCLKVNSAYRSYEQQKALWEGRTSEKYAQRFPDPKIRRKYVSNPDECGNNCPHFTGNAADVVYPWRTTKTMTRYEWEILHEIMSKAGWVRYGDEKVFTIGERWHFECCETPRYARAKEKGVTAIV